MAPPVLGRGAEVEAALEHGMGQRVQRGRAPRA